MGVEDIMRERGADVESDPRNLPTTPQNDATSSPAETPTDRAAEAMTEDAPATGIEVPSLPQDPLGDRVDVKLSLDDMGNVAAALSLAAKIFG